MDETSPKQEDRGPRIPLAKIQNIDLGAKIAIFHRIDRNSPLQTLDVNFPKGAAVVFCDRIHRENIDNNAKSFIITRGDVQAFKDMLEWILLSVEEGKCVNFKTYDEESPLLFTKYALAIEAANYLGIPARDFSEGLVKRLTTKTARDVLMNWDEVVYFYDKYGDNGLREIAAASIFYAWWKGKLDEDETPDQMEELSLLREEIPDLDEDLHKFCEKNENTVREGWERKKKEKEEAKNSAEGNTGGGWDAPDNNTATAEPSGWEITGGDTGGAAGGWDQGNVNPGSTSGNWDDGTTAAATPAEDEYVKVDGFKVMSSNGGAGDWAEEVIEHDQIAGSAW